jgi:hypothetical protein
MRWLRASAFTVLGALAAWLMVGRGLVNYDTLYDIVWGRQIAHGQSPDMTVPLAPTPHPLATLAGVIGSPLTSAADGFVHGVSATDATIVVAFLALGALAWVVYELGAAWFNPWAGALAALIVITRQPILDYGARAYVDIPYMVLVLGALLVETRRRQAGIPVLVLLGLAGLLRPEAWLLSGAYVVYLAYVGPRERTRLALLVGAAAAAPLLWFAADWIFTGDPLHSLTGTRDTAQRLARITGLGAVPGTVPRRLGEILREPVLFGGVVGLVCGWLWLRDRVRLGIAAGVLMLAAFCVLAAAGLPILGRYLMLPAAIGAILCGGGAFGWLSVGPEQPQAARHRTIWMWLGVLVLLVQLPFLPASAHRISAERHSLTVQDDIQNDLKAFVRQGQFQPPCTTVTVPNHRPVPLLALWLDQRPSAVHSAIDGGVPAFGTYVQPATARVAKQFILDPRDVQQTLPPPPPAYRLATANASWRLYKHCAPAAVTLGGE